MWFRQIWHWKGIFGTGKIPSPLASRCVPTFQADLPDIHRCTDESSVRQDIGTKLGQNKREISVPDMVLNWPVMMKSHQLSARLDAEEQVEGTSRVASEICGPVITKVAAPNALHGRGSLPL
jgi:hypothetical protein